MVSVEDLEEMGFEVTDLSQLPSSNRSDTIHTSKPETFIWQLSNSDSLAYSFSHLQGNHFVPSRVVLETLGVVMD